MQNENVFYCYSAKVRRYLNDHNVRWFEKGINPKSERPYWKYEINDKLQEHLNSYKDAL